MTNMSIPASAIVNVTPSVLAAGGTGLDLSGLILTNSPQIPTGEVDTFSNVTDVATAFGASSVEAELATRYFGGYTNSPAKPGALHFAQYPAAAVVPQIRGGNIAAMTLASLQALSGALAFVVNGVPVASAAINLSTATSFSNAAQIIEDGINYHEAVFTAAIAGTTMTVSAVASGNLAVGHVIVAGGVTAGTRIVAFGTGTGGTGTYIVDVGQTVASGTIRAGRARVTYDATLGGLVVAGGTPGASGTITFATGTLSEALHLTAATGARLSQGANAGVPATNMAAVIDRTQNFATFMTAFKPSISDMVAFATWANGTGSRFLYAMWDNDPAALSQNDTTSAGHLVRQAELSGTCPIYDATAGASVAAFFLGALASIRFDVPEGRTNVSFRSQAGLVPSVTSRAAHDRLIANGYNFYGRYATATDQFQFFYPGTVSGPFAYVDSFVNQIWLNDLFQLRLMELLATTRSLPYNAQGYALIEATLGGAIDQAVEFGAIRAGVPLDALQTATVNNDAGREIAPTIEERGWYLLVRPASPSVRAARGSPPVTFWYTDGGSIQSINLNSVEVQ